jgi:putative addiction module component (TIGR02574 family)
VGHSQGAAADEASQPVSGEGPSVPGIGGCFGSRGALSDMSNADIAEILKLPVEERLRLVELIWESIAANPSVVPVGDAHRAVIDERLAEHAREPDDVLTRDEMLAEARRG